jgi:WD40 repeat protein/tRNA A-37 threonylcarbamoyl transferase component Bud32
MPAQAGDSARPRDPGPPSTLADDRAASTARPGAGPAEPSTELEACGIPPTIPEPGSIPPEAGPPTSPAFPGEATAELGAWTTEADERGAPGWRPPAVSPWQAGHALGDYLLLEKLAEGGMGVVYKARQVRANRLVALKAIRAGVFATERERALFQSEVEAVASLDHPNIVPVFEVGEHQGVRWYSMKLVNGRSLQESLARFHGHHRRIARLVFQIAGAIQHAHERGVLHRDLKPSNILVDDEDGPHVIDFGLARRLAYDESQGATRTNPVGTPPYMAPEQAQGRRRAITTATDVYGLGTILYALLSGQPPFQADSPVETLQKVINEEPRPPRAIDPQINEDLETICLKCLRKDPGSRYHSARELKDDLERWLDGKPILARPVARSQRAWMWLRRHPAISALSAALVLAVTLGLAVSTWQWWRAERILMLARASEELARRHAYFAVFSQAARDWDEGNVDQVRARLTALVPGAGQSDIRGFEWHYFNWLCRTQPPALQGHSDSVLRAAFLPDGRTLASIAEDHTIRLWDGATREPVHVIAAGPSWPLALAVHPAGDVLATGSDDGLVRFWEVATGLLIRWIPAHGKSIQSLSFSPDGGVLATASEDGTVGLWDFETGRPLRVLGGPANPVLDVAFSPDGAAIAASYTDGTVRIWDAGTGRPAHALKAHETWTGRLAFSPDGRTLASASQDGMIKLWDVRSGSLIRTLARPLGQEVRCLAFSPDGGTLASAGSDRIVTLWDVLTGRAVRRFRGHGGLITDLAYSPDGKALASSCVDQLIKVWDPDRDQDAENLQAPGTSDPAQVVYRVAFSPDGRYLASASYPFPPPPRPASTIRLWDGPSGVPLRTITVAAEFVYGAAFQPGGDLMASVDSRGMVSLWEPSSGRWRGGWEAHRGKAYIGVFDRTGRLLATGGEDGQVKLWDIGSRRLLWEARAHEGAVTSLAFTPDGTLLASGGDDRAVRLWRTATGEPEHAFVGHAGRIWSLGISLDGTWLAAAAGNDILVRDLRTRRPVYRLRGHTQEALSLAFSGDGKRLVSGGADQTIRIWDMHLGHELATLRGHRAYVLSVAVRPDDRTLASGGLDGMVRLWGTRREGPISPTPGAD